MSTAPNRIGISGRAVFRTGIGLVLAGMLFLLRYSIDQGWFSPEARLILGGAVSVALIAVGVSLPRPVYGRLLQGAGVAGGYATVWAAYARYDLVDGTTSVVQLLTVAAVGIGLAWRERSDVLSALGLLGAVVAPTLVGGGFESQVVIVGYQIGFLILASVLYIVQSWKMSWAVVVMSTAIALSVESAFEESTAVLAVGIAVWWLVGWALPVLGGVVGLEEGTEVITVSTLWVPVGAWLGVLVAFPHWAAAAAGVLAFAHLATWLLNRSDRADAVLHLLMTYGFTSIVLVDRLELATAIPVYLLLTMAVALIGSRRGDVTTMVVGYALAAPALLFWLVVIGEAGSLEWSDALRDLASVAVMAAAAALLIPGRRLPAGVSAYAMAILWLARYPGEIDTGWATAGMALLGVGALVAGRLSGSRILVWGGLGTLALSVAKLIFADLAAADPVLRIGLALGIGIALLAVGYWIGDSDVLPAVARTDDENPERSETGRAPEDASEAVEPTLG